MKSTHVRGLWLWTWLESGCCMFTHPTMTLDPCNSHTVTGQELATLLITLMKSATLLSNPALVPACIFKCQLSPNCCWSICWLIAVGHRIRQVTETLLDTNHSYSEIILEVIRNQHCLTQQKMLQAFQPHRITHIRTSALTYVCTTVLTIGLSKTLMNQVG